MRRFALVCCVGLLLGYSAVEVVDRWTSDRQDRARIMLDTFERYCAPYFGIKRPFWDVRPWHVEDLPNLGIILTDGAFRLERRQNVCSVADDSWNLTEAERARLARLFERWAGRSLIGFENFSLTNDPEWIVYEGWQSERDPVPGRRVAFIAISNLNDGVGTLLGSGKMP